MFFEKVKESVARGQISYAPHAPRYLEIQYRIYASAVRSAIRKWIAAESTILDVGCGHGELMEALTSGYRVYGVDLSFGLLGAAKRRRLRVYQGNAMALPFSPDRFDAVVCIEVLQHVTEPRLLLLELARVCRPGGALIISTLNKRSLLRRLFLLLSRRSRLGSFDLPIIKRTAQEVCDAAHGCGWLLRDASWVLSPTRYAVYGRPPAPIREQLATNYILYFTKDRPTG